MYVSGGSAVAAITVPMAESLGWPTQGHIALTENDDEMAVMYVTGTSTTPYVKYGLDPNSLDGVVSGETGTYSAAMMCNAPASTIAQVQYCVVK